MRTIMTVNSKGGCGKTTLATNLASFYATEGKNVVLADFDPQQSSLEWLDQRPENYPEILGLDAVKSGFRIPRSTDVLIMDAPAATHGKELADLVKRADTLLIPVLPSPLDMRAAAHFIEELLLNGKVSRKQTKVAVIANRVREYTLSYQALEAFLSSMKIPFTAVLRDTQNYIRAAEKGLGIFEMAPSSVWQDLEQWEELTDWLKSRSSLPKAA
ncbi:MAG: ParA family protein [Gammaproteobacteria bacterium]